MIEVEPFNFVSIDEIQNNISFYKERFIEDGLIVFRGANLTHNQHLVFHDLLCKELGAHREVNPNGYVENHSRVSDDLKTKAQEDGIILTWHIEHPHYVNPIVIGSWNMHKFTAQEDSGKTYFVDTKNLFNIMPSDFKEFAKKSIIINPVGKAQGIPPEHKLVDKHWITDDLVIRISHLNETGNHYQTLHTYDGNTPTSQDKKMYEDIMRWIQYQLSKNLNIRIVHKWRQGDIVVPDMYKMCHSVSGGFKSEEREFTGIWGRQYKHDNRN